MTQAHTEIFKNRVSNDWLKEFDSDCVFNTEFIRPGSSDSLLRTPSRGPSPLKLEVDYKTPDMLSEDEDGPEFLDQSVFK